MEPGRTSSRNAGSGNVFSAAWCAVSTLNPIIALTSTRTMAISVFVVNNTFGKEIDTLDSVWNCASNFPELAQKLSDVYSVNLDLSNAKWLREEHTQREERANRSPPVEFDAVKILRKGLSKIEQGSSAYWWELNLVFFAQTDGQIDFHKELSGNLATLPLWTAISEDDRARLVAAAHRYITEYEANFKLV